MILLIIIVLPSPGVHDSCSNDTGNWGKKQFLENNLKLSEMLFPAGIGVSGKFF
jgi:hypothetical protein